MPIVREAEQGPGRRQSGHLGCRSALLQMLGGMHERDDSRGVGLSNSCPGLTQQGGSISMDKRLAVIAQRGITLPELTRKQIRQSGIFCRPSLEMVFQENAQRWAIRGEES